MDGDFYLTKSFALTEHCNERIIGRFPWTGKRHSHSVVIRPQGHGSTAEFCAAAQRGRSATAQTNVGMSARIERHLIACEWLGADLN